MQNRDIYLMILGMTLVTYLPRVLPAFLMGRIRLSARVEHFLQLIPYTAMTALVFPGVFSVDANPVLGVVGAAVAGGLAWKKCPHCVCAGRRCGGSRDAAGAGQRDALECGCGRGMRGKNKAVGPVQGDQLLHTISPK